MQLTKPATYLAVGATGVPIDIAFTTLASIGVGIVAAQAVGWVVAATWNWTWNRRKTWASDAEPLREWARYLGVDAGRLAVRVGVVAVVASAVPGIIATVLGITAAAALGFVGFDRMVFSDA
ncbi:GtrA family protein [Haloplanus halophilus]|uniref:GtrA family protein n=1 Tax=Haloplanus halophilus TaxID=2949993 RepID=UPI00203DDD49|nr:GtrA family protein [Haloplanus sp. GDY1]